MTDDGAKGGAKGDRRWVFLGAGNMASSIVGGLIDAGRPVGEILLIDPHQATRERAAARFGTPVASGPGDARQRHAGFFADGACPGIVLAVKPNIVEAACRELADQGLVSGNAFVSIAAGVRMAAIEHWLDQPAAIVRCMPNTPALIGLGASALYANGAVDETLLRQTRALFASVGSVVLLDTEAQIDAVTALSGSGPAYVFRLVELMSETGAALGLDADTARALAIRTCEGAAAMLAEGTDSPETLRVKVTSPNGTTAAALDRFAADGLAGCVQRAMQAAHDRAVELGNDFMPSQQ